MLEDEGQNSTTLSDEELLEASLYGEKTRRLTRDVIYGAPKSDGIELQRKDGAALEPRQKEISQKPPWEKEGKFVVHDPFFDARRFDDGTRGYLSIDRWRKAFAPEEVEEIACVVGVAGSSNPAMNVCDSYSLPLTIYTAVLASSLASNNLLSRMSRRTMVFARLLVIGPPVIGAAVSVLAQILFIYKIHHMVTDESFDYVAGGECDRNLPLYQVIALGVFTGSILDSLFESKSIVDWLFTAPSLGAPAGEYRGLWQMGDYEQSSPTKASQETVYLKTADGSVYKTERWVPGTGLSLAAKATAFVTVVLPKAAIELSLGFVGAPYILYSDGVENLILNCLALLFVLDIDDIAYKLFVTRKMEQYFEALPPAISIYQGTQEWDFREKKWVEPACATTSLALFLFGQLLGGWARLVLFVAFTAGTFKMWC